MSPPGFELGLQAVAADVNVITNSMNVGGGLGVRLERHADGRPRTSVGLTFLYAPNDLLQNPDDISLHWTALAVTGCPPFSLGRILTLQRARKGSAAGCPPPAEASAIQALPVGAGGAWVRFCAQARTSGVVLRSSWRPGRRFLSSQRQFYVGSLDTIVGKTPTIAPVIALGLSLAL